MTGAEGQWHTAFGVYREIDRPHRLVYTWDWEEDDYRVGETLVTVEFKNLGEATEVVLTSPAPKRSRVTRRAGQAAWIVSQASSAE
jgi:uncharacterized protein YndB with AHSA1/START domain